MLDDALKTSGKTRDEFAADLGISVPMLSMLLRGKRRPSLDLALRISLLTNGRVPVEFWADASGVNHDSVQECSNDPSQSSAA